MLKTTSRGRYRATFHNWNKKKPKEVTYTSKQKDHTKTLLIVIAILIGLTLLIVL